MATNLAVDGSVTPIIFGVRNPTGVDIPLSFDCARVTFKCLTDTAVDLSKFGDIAGGIVNGLIMRRVNGIYSNIFNVKTNGDLKNITFDFDIQTLTGQGQDGFTARLTFTRLGVVSRLITSEDLQIIVQDNLSSLDNFEIIAQGHIVTEEIKP